MTARACARCGADTEDLGIKLENLKIDDLGKAKKVTIDKDNTTLVEGGTSQAIEGRVKQLRTQIEETTSDCDREKRQERLAKLVGGVAVIKVGALPQGRRDREGRGGRGGRRQEAGTGARPGWPRNPWSARLTNEGSGLRCERSCVGSSATIA